MPTSQVLYQPKYFGDFPTNAKKNERLPAVTIITKDEFERIQSEITGLNIHERRESYKDEKLALHNSSKQRIQNWGNTVLGQRKRRIQAREERLAEEEAARVELDNQHELFVQQKRQESIQRAKELLYNELDYVKQFHSKLLMHQVLKERDLQMEYKKRERKLNAKYYDRLQPMEDIFGNNPERLRIDETHRQHHLEAAAAQKEQWLKKKENERQAKQKILVEGKELVEKDLELHRKEIAEKKSLKAAGQKEIRKSLEQITKEISELKAKEVELNEIEDKKANRWKVKKENLVAKRKTIEEERFKEMLAIKESIGMKQQKEFHQERELDNQRTEKAAFEALRRASLLVKLKEEKSAARLLEIKQHREEVIKAKKEEVLKKKEESKECLAEYIKDAEIFEEENQKKREENRKLALSFQNVHKQQINEMKNNRDAFKRETNSFHNYLMNKKKVENANFLEYMKSIPNEEWVKGDDKNMNSFLDAEYSLFQRLNDEKVHKNPNQIPINLTSQHLGFSGHDDEGDREPLVGFLTSSSI